MKTTRHPRQIGDRSARHPSGPQRRAVSRASRRRGIEVFELILCTPVIVMATFALFEFGFALLTYQTLVTATGEAAREVAKLSGTSAAKLAAAKTIVDRFLHAQNDDINVSVDGNIRIEDGPNGSNVTLNGNPCFAADTPVTVTATEIRVTVCLKLTNASNKPVPNWLSSFGFSTSGKHFEFSSLVPIE